MYFKNATALNNDWCFILMYLWRVSPAESALSGLMRHLLTGYDTPIMKKPTKGITFTGLPCVCSPFNYK